MKVPNTVIAIFNDHATADAAVRTLASSGFDIKNLSVVGKGYHTEEKVAGFYNVGDRVKIWGAWGAFWGGLWGLFLGGLFLTVPVVGHMIVLGYLGTVVVSALEGAVVVGGLGAIGAALASIGVPKDSMIRYERAVKADGFLVLAHGTKEEVDHARAILDAAKASSVDVYEAAASDGEPPTA